MTGSASRRCMLRVILGAVLVMLGACTPPKPDSNTRNILVSGAMSLSGKYSENSSKILAGASAAIKWVNETHGGIKLADGKIGRLQLEYVDDFSDATGVESGVKAACAKDNVDFLLGPYSSDLTATALSVADTCGKLLLNHGGANDALTNGSSDKIISSIAPASQYHLGVLDAIYAAVGGNVSGLTVAFTYEDESFTKALQRKAHSHAEELGFQIGYDSNYPNGATTLAEFDSVVQALATDVPDILLGGGHAVDGRALLWELFDQGVLPKAISFLVAPADPDFFDMMLPCPGSCDFSSHPGESVSSPSQWEMGLQFDSQAAASAGMPWFGPSEAEYASDYLSFVGYGQPSYHAANGAAMILSLAYAIEQAQSLDTDEVRRALVDSKFMSFWGVWDVDDNGTNTGHGMVEVQWQQGEKHIVWPANVSTAQYRYPAH